MYSTIPFDSISISDNNPQNLPLFLFDGKSQTYITLNGIGSYIQVNFFYEHFVQAVDLLLFKRGLRHFISIEYLDNGHLQPLGIFTIMSDDVSPTRIHLPYVFTKSLRIKFLSVEEEDGHLLSEVKISELRVLGHVDKDEPQTIMPVVNLPCPAGYFKDENGQCISDKTFNHYTYKKVQGDFHKRNDKIVFEFETLKKVDAIYIKIGPHENLSFVINIPNKLQVGFPFQRFLTENCIVLNNTVENVNLVELILCTDTELEVEQFILLGEK